MTLPKTERTIVALIAAVQFINVLEFMIVLPLGPDFATALGIPTSHLGSVGGAYTASAAVSGLVASSVLERFDRRKALAVAMAGLVVATLAAGAAVDLATLLLARVLAGAFGGPATAVSLAIIADSIAPERRGKAMGSVMGAFSIASVLGVPAGLELARHGGWRLPFIGVALLGAIVTAFAVSKLPPMRAHLERGAPARGAKAFLGMVKRPIVGLAYAQTAIVSLSTFLVIPNFAPFIQLNLGFPRERLGALYLCGGVASFVAMRAVGRLTDRFGAAATGSMGSLLVALAVYLVFLGGRAAEFVPVLFTLFMVSNGARMVPCQTQNSRVPRPDERARFLSVQSTVQHLSASAGAFLSSRILAEGAGGRLVGMETVAALSIGASLVVPLLLWAVHSRLGVTGKEKRMVPTS